MILSNYTIGEIIYYIMDCKILEKEVIGVKEVMLKKLDVIEKELRYKIDITTGGGWIAPDKIFGTKIEAGKHLLAMNGLDVTLKETK